MDIEIGKITSKGQMTIPVSIRKALAIGSGDEVLIRVENNQVVMKKAQPLDVEYFRAVQSSFNSEWNSKEDDEAYRDL